MCVFLTKPVGTGVLHAQPGSPCAADARSRCRGRAVSPWARGASRPSQREGPWGPGPGLSGDVPRQPAGCATACGTRQPCSRCLTPTGEPPALPGGVPARGGGGALLKTSSLRSLPTSNPNHSVRHFSILGILRAVSPQRFHSSCIRADSSCSYTVLRQVKFQYWH